ncbi:branched-chain alpha-keto acid dehydrogenase subunit E2 [Candidatus Aerophobetes bacterium]|uniref:Dihydrolipoamide acetyltransferase component of pyruvate dehydrogenase complex n=1 Tax=Aerophobetes bacterium TaxID=2030807 RepID=A0A2A4X1Z7_UNCAE|nr:MAG: branched-chain alpha-keto acid dehydrogenase subunit E2 [Candidatus Aerophobetes bacterium]
MTKSVEIVLPKLGESILNATVVQWLKQEGDEVKLDEAIVEVSTDKVNSEIPSPVAGYLEKICVEEGIEVDVGAVIAIIQAEGKASGDSIEAPAAEVLDEKEPDNDAPSSKFYTPVVLKIAKEKGITQEELASIKRTGTGGRLSRKDLQTHLEQRCSGSSSSSSSEESLEQESGEDSRPVKMGAMRQMIARNLVKSFYEAPHASLVFEVDITKALAKIKKEKVNFLNKNGFKLTITAFLAKAITEAVLKYPMINSSLKGDTILVKSNVNLGIAVSVKEGVMVPVIAKCQQRSITDLARQVAQLSKLTREGKLSLGQVKEGTITMTNFGMGGAMIGIPIIRFPEVAIIGIGAIRKKPVVDEEEKIVVRDMVNLSLTFDHRVIDGIYGCDFLMEVKLFFADENNMQVD